VSSSYSVVEKILTLLRQKHREDVFVTECKSGPTWHNATMCRMDAWAMRRSWRNLCMRGYEIKVARSDFLNDNKWPRYLRLCNELYFVSPPSVIDVFEVPKEAGLLILSKTGSRLWTKKKAPYREITLPHELLLYILMCRATIVGPYHFEDTSNIEYWKSWLHDKKAKLELGTRCSQKLHKSYREQVEEVRKKQKLLQDKLDSYQRIEEMCKELGIDLNTPSWRIEFDFKRKIELALKLLPEGFVTKLELLQEQLTNVIKQCRDLELGAER